MALSHLRMINGLIGLCQPQPMPGWPNPLNDLGYVVEGIETKFLNTEGHTLNPDLILVSSPQNASLLFECKSGTWQSGETDQVANYANLSLEVLVRFAGISPRSF